MPYPAVLIGGPPHSGKSVLARSLKIGLQNRSPHLLFYLFRAAPDGEGDWFLDADPNVARRLRRKFEFSPRYAELVSQAIRQRYMPLLVDVGGKISPEQKRIAASCTHAILISSDRAQLLEWERFAREMGLQIIASLISRLDGEDRYEDGNPLRGEITRLERSTIKQGPILDALVERVYHIFAPWEQGLREFHYSISPVKPVIDLEYWPQNRFWRPDMLPDFLRSIHKGEALAAYGISPNWVYAALAMHVYPAPFYQFDAVLGWITPPELQVEDADAPFWDVNSYQIPHGIRLEMRLRLAYIPYSLVKNHPVPTVKAGNIFLSGKLPMWLWTSWVRAYVNMANIYVFQPQVGDVLISGI